MFPSFREREKPLEEQRVLLLAVESFLAGNLKE
jgi:hypothetical protein